MTGREGRSASRRGTVILVGPDSDPPVPRVERAPGLRPGPSTPSAQPASAPCPVDRPSDATARGNRRPEPDGGTAGAAEHPAGPAERVGSESGRGVRPARARGEDGRPTRRDEASDTRGRAEESRL
jgi:hypothetical protein